MPFPPMLIPMVVAQRIAVVVSCILLWILGFNKELTTAPEIGILVCLAACACVEKLAAVMNLVSVERDWVCHSLICRQDCVYNRNADCFKGRCHR